MENKIKKFIEEKINPQLEMDGGSAEFVSFKDGILKLKMRGACAHCPHSKLTLGGMIYGMLKPEFPEIDGVESAD